MVRYTRAEFEADEALHQEHEVFSPYIRAMGAIGALHEIPMDQEAWRSSSFGSGVEVNMTGLGGRVVAFRDGKDPNGPMSVFTRAELEAFALGARGGEFNRYRHFHRMPPYKGPQSFVDLCEVWSGVEVADDVDRYATRNKKILEAIMRLLPVDNEQAEQ